MSTNRYKLERLPNGYVRVDDRASGLVGLFNTDGSYRSGALHAIPGELKEQITRTALWGTTEPTDVQLMGRIELDFDGSLIVRLSFNDTVTLPSRIIADLDLFNENRETFISYSEDAEITAGLLAAMLWISRRLEAVEKKELIQAVQTLCEPGPPFTGNPDLYFRRISA